MIFSVACTLEMSSTCFDSAANMLYNLTACSYSSISNRIRYQVEDLAIYKKKEEYSFIGFNDCHPKQEATFKTFKCWNLA